MCCGKWLGDGSYVGLSFNTWAGGENSKECLIGKRVGVFADVRFKPGRAYGASFDPGGIGHVSTELLLNIIGEDTVTIGRKDKTPWHGQLRLKMMLISNEVPNLNDASGVLPSRFVKLRFGVSFFGREDVNLRESLSGELSGIAARCVGAYQRLCDRGRFVQPESADALERDVIVASDPFTAMALECFAADPGGEVVKVVAYNRFERWCRENGRIDILRGTPANRFGEKLKAVAGFEQLGSIALAARDGCGQDAPTAGTAMIHQIHHDPPLHHGFPETPAIKRHMDCKVVILMDLVDYMDSMARN